MAKKKYHNSKVAQFVGKSNPYKKKSNLFQKVAQFVV